MTINRLLARSSLRPEEIRLLNDAYKRALRALHLVDRNDPLTEIVAKKIVEVSKVIAIQRRFPSLRSRSLDFHKAASVGLVWYW